jgi:hypothetical protein
MATPRKIREQPHGTPPPAGTEPGPGGEESLGEQLIREARDGQVEFVAGWSKFMEELGIHGKPMGAKKLRAMLLQVDINPDDNEFSRGIIAMREE